MDNEKFFVLENNTRLKYITMISTNPDREKPVRTEWYSFILKTVDKTFVNGGLTGDLLTYDKNHNLVFSADYKKHNIDIATVITHPNYNIYTPKYGKIWLNRYPATQLVPGQELLLDFTDKEDPKIIHNTTTAMLIHELDNRFRI